MTDRIRVLVVEPDATCRIETINGDWQSIKSLIGGWLEAVSGVMGHWIAYGDEEGNLKGLPQNPLATGIIMAADGAPVPPVGTVVFVGMTYVGGEDGYTEADCPRELIELAFPGGMLPPNSDL